VPSVKALQPSVVKGAKFCELAIVKKIEKNISTRYFLNKTVLMIINEIAANKAT
jgi:hypothetical protein